MTKKILKHETKSECHAQIGLGVATLGSSCVYEEGHDGPHSYSKGKGCKLLARICNKHPQGCPNAK